MIEDINARREAMHQYAAAHDRFGARMIDLRKAGKPYDAAGAQEFARRLFKAWQAEMLDPRPEDLR